MTRTIESLEEINLGWLNETLSSTEEFSQKKVTELNVKRIGEGIGQLGEFALLDTTLDCGQKLNIFAKIQRNFGKIRKFHENLRNFAKNLRILKISSE